MFLTPAGDLRKANVSPYGLYVVMNEQGYIVNQHGVKYGLDRLVTDWIASHPMDTLDMDCMSIG